MGVKKNNNTTIKFVCSYGGKILPRKPAGDLRYVGGLTRILAVRRSISFSELMVKLEEFCGFSVNLRSQLPNGDLETLVSIRSDDELESVVEEYEQASRKSSAPPPLKIRAVLTPLKVVVSPPPSSASSAEIFARTSELLAAEQESEIPLLHLLCYGQGRLIQFCDVRRHHASVASCQ